MRIDAHQHYWRIARGDYGWLTPALAPIYRDYMPDDLAPLRLAGGIDFTIAVQAAPTEAETVFLLDLAQREPSIAGVVGWTDFDGPDAPQRIAALARDRLLVGLRPMIQDIADPDWMLSAPVDAALRAMVQAGLVFDALVKPHQLSRLLVLADRHPDLAIVIDHGAKPAIASGVCSPWQQDMAALASRRHVSVKLSGLVTEAGTDWSMDQIRPYVGYLIDIFGPDRVLFGSDWPVLELAGSYGGWLGAAEALTSHLDDAARAGIFGGNARRLYLDQRGRS